MQFRTPLSVSPSPWRISHHSLGFALGSCFSEAMASRLAHLKYNVTSNPFGPLYNPSSLASCIRRVAACRGFEMDELCVWRGVWFSTDSHTLMASPSAEQTLLQLNSALVAAHQALVRADYVILTLGTNRVYEREGRVVANCHRLPAEQFECRSLGVGEIVEELVSVCQNELAGKQIILTVSPIRHLKDGLAENSLSKATLRVAAAEVAERLPQVCYFPAYEALVDDLRDYRFYAADMVHPSEQAVEYVWGLFAGCYLSSADEALNQSIMRLVRSCQHRPLNPSSPECREFLERTIGECRAFASAHPEVDLSAEIEELTQRLESL